MHLLARFALAGLALSATGASVPAAPVWTVHSAIEDYRFTPSNGLIGIARATDSEGYCDRWGVIKAKSAGGRQAEARGWRVTGEAKLGPLTAVSIIRKYLGAPSATCVPIDGNVAVYDGATLVGILYVEKNAELEIGDVVAWDGRVRIFGISQMPPVGDLVIRGRQVRFEQLAAVDHDCGGKVAVPSLYNLSIFQARRKLIAAGWQPIRQRQERNEDGYLEDINGYHAQGVHEVLRCAGTGWGFCQFQYRSKAGVMTVMTAYNYHTKKEGVMDFGVDCASPRRRPIR